jgi:transposase
MDESYIHATHTKQNAWSSDAEPCLQVPIATGKRAIIVNAGNENGFVPNAALVFKSGIKTGDYHNDMNFENYEKWLKTQLIPNLPPRSVLVIDNAPYHNVQLNKAPTSSSRRAEMTDWLAVRNIPFCDSMYKPDLYTLIKLNKPRFVMYKIDAMLEEHGHSTLRLPPYHPDLNPIELIWASVKDYVAKKNVTFNLDDAIKLVNEKFNAITKEEWASCCRHAVECEEKYFVLEREIDLTSEQIIISLGEDDSSSDSSDIDEDEGELSGVEPLP